jgi:hypothetical protein
MHTRATPQYGSKLLGAALSVAALLAAPAARADETAAARRAEAAHEMDRPYTMAEVSGGVLALPGAEVCPTSLDQCSRGEVSLAVGIHNLYRYGPVGVGAGILWATTLRSDSAQGAEVLERDHSRRYFIVEGALRYYGIRVKSWELWAGGTLGMVVVNDSWSVKADRDPPADTAFVGPRAATLGTEGLATGVGVGTEFSFFQNWAFGANLRYSMWFLPDEREVSPTGDLASLSGRVDMFDVGLLLSYRIAL